MKDHAQLTASAFDPLLGKTPNSGTPFNLQELVVSEGRGMHVYRQGKYAKFIEEVYKDWIIPYIAKEVTNGTRFLSTLTADEMKYVADCVTKSSFNAYYDELVLNGQPVPEPEERTAMEDKFKQEFVSKGNQHFLEILKGELSKKPIGVKVNVKGKQKDLGKAVDKLVNIWRMIISNPQGFQQAMQDPQMARDFNEIRELSGMSPAKYFYQPQAPIQPQGMPQVATQGMEQLTANEA